MTTQRRVLDAGDEGRTHTTATEELTWLPGDELAAKLHCSERQLVKYKVSGVFEPGVHYYTVGSRGRHIHALELCRQTLLDLTKKQEALARSKRRPTYDMEHVSQLVEGNPFQAPRY